MNNSKPDHKDKIPKQDKKTICFSLELNKQIKEFEKENGVTVIVTGHGFKQYPNSFPGQDRLQLFSVYPLGNE